MVRFLTIMAFLLSVLPSMAGENCTCRHKDAEIREGQTACIRTPKGSQMAKCERVLNNTSWKFLDKPCPYASLEHGQDMSTFDLEKAKTRLEKAG